MSIAVTGHAGIGTVDTMIGVTGTVTGRRGGIITATAENGNETNAGSKIGVGRPTGRIVAMGELAATAGSGCKTTSV